MSLWFDDQWFDDNWFFTKPLTIVVIVAVAFVVARVARWLVKLSMRRMLGPKAQERHLRFRERAPSPLVASRQHPVLRTEARVHTLTTVLQSLVSVLVWVIAAFWILSILDVNLGPLIATAGIVGVALGFGAQFIVRDFLAGFFIVAEDQLGVGDYVNLGDDVVKGRVERVTLRTIQLRGDDGTVWHVPNGEIKKVGNISQGDAEP